MFRTTLSLLWIATAAGTKQLVCRETRDLCEPCADGAKAKGCPSKLLHSCERLMDLCASEQPKKLSKKLTRKARKLLQCGDVCEIKKKPVTFCEEDCDIEISELRRN